MLPVVLGLAGLAAKAAAVAAVSRLVKVVASLSSAPAQDPASFTEVHSVAAEEAIVETLPRPKKSHPGQWQIRTQIRRETPPLLRWTAPAGARGPPLQIARSSFKASLHPQSYPINRVDPDGLQPGDGTDYTSGGMWTRFRQMRDRFLPGAQGDELAIQAITSLGDAEDTIDPRGYLLGAAAAAAYHHLKKPPPLEQIGGQLSERVPGTFTRNDVKMQVVKGKAIVNIGRVDSAGDVKWNLYFEEINKIAHSKGASEVVISWAADNPKSTRPGFIQKLGRWGFQTELDAIEGAATRVILRKRL